MKGILSVSIAAALSVAAMPASAQEQVTISYADLDLETVAGQQRLDRRVRAAVDKICKVNERPTGSLLRSRASLECANESYAKARQQVAAIIEDRKLGG